MLPLIFDDFTQRKRINNNLEITNNNNDENPNQNQNNDDEDDGFKVGLHEKEDDVKPIRDIVVLTI